MNQENQDKDPRRIQPFPKPGELQTPEGYFQGLTGKIMDRVADENTLEKAPNLRAIPKVNPFLVPVGYFEGLTSQIMESLGGGGKVIKLNSFSKAMIAIAAALALLVSIGGPWLWQNRFQDPASFTYMGQMSEEQLLMALEPMDYDLETIVLAMEEDISTTNIPEDLSLEDEAVQDLLMDVNIEDVIAN